MFKEFCMPPFGVLRIDCVNLSIANPLPPHLGCCDAAISFGYNNIDHENLNLKNHWIMRHNYRNPIKIDKLIYRWVTRNCVLLMYIRSMRRTRCHKISIRA